MIVSMHPLQHLWRTLAGLCLCVTLWIVCIASLQAEDSGEQPDQSIVVMIDGSRSSGQYADRIALIADAFLPWFDNRRIFVFDYSLRDRSEDGLVGEAYTSIVSDYYQAFEHLSGAELTPAAVVIVGNGFMDVVHADMPEHYTRDLPANATRDIINHQMYQRFAHRYENFLISEDAPLLVLNPDVESGPLWDWLSGGREDFAPMSLETLSLVAVKQWFTQHGINVQGQLLGSGIIQVSETVTTLRIPEGTHSVDILIHGLDNDPNFDFNVSIADRDVSIWDGEGSEPTGIFLQSLMGSGVGRLARLSGLQSGPDVQLSLHGSVQRYEVAVRLHRNIDHRMFAVPPEDTDQLYAGDQVSIGHQWLRRVDGEPISSELADEILASSHLQISPDTMQGYFNEDNSVLHLPDQAGEAQIDLVVDIAWQEVVQTEPLRLRWELPTPLVLRGGWQQSSVYDGSKATLQFYREGGRRPLTSPVVVLLGPDTADPSQISVPLVAHKGEDGWLGEVVFSDLQRGEWRIQTDTPFQGVNETGNWVIDPVGSDVLEVRRNWLPLLLGLLALLLLLLALLLWWLMSRVRMGDELLLSNDRQLPLRACPGPRPRDTSCLFADCGQAVVVRATRKGCVIDAIGDDCAVYLNARPAQVGDILQSGNDLEVICGDKRRHGQFFQSPEGLHRWSSDQAQIDPIRDFDEEYLVVDINDSGQGF